MNLCVNSSNDISKIFLFLINNLSKINFRAYYDQKDIRNYLFLLYNLGIAELFQDYLFLDINQKER